MTSPAVPDEPLGLPVVAGFLLFCVCTAFVILGLTGYTYQLDDVKLLGLYTGGGICLVAWALLWAGGHVAAPSRWVVGSYAVYVVVCMASAVAAQPFVKWIAWQYVGYVISLMGFVLLGSSVITHRRMVEYSLKFWVLMALSTTLFGMAHYGGLMGPLLDWMYPTAPTGDDRLYVVLKTFRDNRAMLSTILNVQFFGNLLMMLLPVALATVVMSYGNMRGRLMEGRSISQPVGWLTATALAAVLCIACVFLTYSKSSFPLLPLGIGLFVAGLFILVGVRRVPHFWKMTAMLGILAAVVLFHTWPDFQSRLKDLDDNLGPRAIIFGGAIEMWKDNPVLGGGAGSFRVLFPEYRNPDYHMNRVSNVTIYAHNWLLELACERGTLGLLAYLAFLGGIVRLAVRTMRKCPDLAVRVAALGCSVGLICLLLGALLTPMTSWAVGSVALHAMLGTTLGIVHFGSRRINSMPVVKSEGVVHSESAALMRGALVLGTLVYAIYISSWSLRIFEASRLHNEGIKRSEFLGLPAGTVTEPHLVSLFREAINYFEQSLKMNPGSPTTYYKLGNAYSRLGMVDEALGAYERLTDYAPNYSEMHFNTAVMHYTRAVDFQTALGKATDEEKLALRDAIGAAWERCIEDFGKAAKQSNKISVWFYHGNSLLLAAGAPSSISQEQRRDLHRRAAEVFERTTELPVSQVIQEVGQQSVERDLRFRAHTLAAESYERAGMFLDAARVAERYVASAPVAEIAWVEKAVKNYQRAERVDDALRLVDTVLADNPLNGAARRLRFNLLADANRVPEALEEAHLLLTLDETVSNDTQRVVSDRQAREVRDRLLKMQRILEEKGS